MRKEMNMRPYYRYWWLLPVLLILGCKNEKKYHDLEKKEKAVVSNKKLDDILAFQEKLNKEFLDPETSPLPDRYRKDFKGLDFFDPDTTYVVIAKLIRTPNAIPFSMPTTTGRKSTEVVFGKARFTLNGEDFELEIYQSPELIVQEKYKDYLFLPFTDDTNGSSTYGGGRYLDLKLPEGDSIVLNFNFAYNPYCAYNKKYSCPLVPAINNLDTKVLAGVKAFKKQ